MLKYKFKEPPLYQTFIEEDGYVTYDGMERSSEEPDSSTKSIWTWMDVKKCPYCGSELCAIDSRALDGEDKDGTWWTFFTEIVACLMCGWWRYQYNSGTELTQITELAMGSILSVEDADFWAPVPAIREYLNKNPSYLRTGLSPVALEQVMRDVFSEYYSCEVCWTGSGPDGGFDLYHVLADGCSTLYQIKRRQMNNKSESVIPIRALLGALIIRNAVNGIYVTTADSFSKPAVIEAKMAGEQGYIIELIDYKRLLDILRSTSPRNHVPWRSLWEGACSVYSDLKSNFL